MRGSPMPDRIFGIHAIRVKQVNGPNGPTARPGTRGEHALVVSGSRRGSREAPAPASTPAQGSYLFSTEIAIALV